MRILGRVISLFSIFLLAQLVWRVVARIKPELLPSLLSPQISLPLRRLITPQPYIIDVLGVQPGQIVLEIGAGSGYVTFPAAEKVAAASGTLYAVDINERSVTHLLQAGQRSNLENLVAVQADVHNLPFPDAMFDLVYMVAVLGALRDPDSALVEVHRVLKPGGILSVSEYILDAHFHFQWEVRDRVMWAGFEALNTHGNWAVYTMNFKKV